MTGQQRKGSTWTTRVAGIVLVGALGVSAFAVAGQANGQPVPVDPAVPVPPTSPAPPAPPPPGPPPVPPVLGNDALQQPGQLGSMGDIWNDLQSPNLMDTLFPYPAAPPTPVRQMPMGPPPPIDPRFLPSP